MDWLSFIASLAKSLAWPTAALLLVLVLRRQVGPALARLLDRATKVKAPGGIEFEFGRELGVTVGVTVAVHSIRSDIAQIALTRP